LDAYSLYDPQPADKFLRFSLNDQWYCLDILDFPLLSSFAAKEKTASPNKYISVSSKTPHPESNLVRLLYRLHTPPPNAISQWAKLIAASVEVMAHELYKPQAPKVVEGGDQLVQGVEVLNYLEFLKKNSSTFIQEENTNPDTQVSEVVTERSHSMEVLHEFCNLLIDVVMGYVILQTHALSPPPLSTNQRKKNSRQTRSSSRNASQLVAQATSGELTRVREESTLQLTAFQNRHNFQPLVFFLIGGVRGLFLVSKNHRNAPLADCMSFAQAMSVIHQHSKTARTPQEPVWKNLSAYLVELFQPSLKTPNQIVPLANPPNPHKLAHAITTDFLSYWSQTQPSSPFIIPHSTRQITEK